MWGHKVKRQKTDGNNVKGKNKMCHTSGMLDLDVNCNWKKEKIKRKIFDCIFNFLHLQIWEGL